MRWYIWIESGECVLAPDHKSAVVMMQSLNSKCQVRSEDVLEEDEFTAVFGGANFSGASLRRANFSGSDLRGSNLTGADLTGTILTGADLTGADLTGAILTGAILANTTMPDGKLFTGKGEEWLASLR